MSAPAAGRDEQPALRGGPEQPAAARSVILESCVRLTFHTVLVFGLYLLFAGHNQPGGGFVGGLVTGTAFVLRYVAGGRAELRAAAPFDPVIPLGLGVITATLTGMGSWVFGADFLTSDYGGVTVPVLGVVKASTVLIFDIGVFAVVVGLVLTLLRTLGAEAER